jgi:uncharacterized protein (TIGR02145 family)
MFSLILILVAASAPALAAESITDPRDGDRYKVVTLGTQRWMAENLRYRTADSRCYENDEGNCAVHGRLYRFPDAMTACPPGWRIPTEEEWQGLERWLGMKESDIVKRNMRAPGLGTRLKEGGDTGFNAKFSGWIDPHLGERSASMGRNAAFWASTETKDKVVWHRDVAVMHEGVWRSAVDITYWLSTRCIEHKPKAQ